MFDTKVHEDGRGLSFESMKTPNVDPKGRNTKDFFLHFLLPEIRPSDENSESSFDFCEVPRHIKCFVISDGKENSKVHGNKSQKDTKKWILMTDVMDYRKWAENCETNAVEFVHKNDFREPNIEEMDGGQSVADFQ